MRTPAALFASLAVVLLAGCAQQAATAITPLATTTPSVATPSYAPIKAADACPTRAPVHLPADAGPVASAYVCSHEFRQVPGAGEWQFLVVKGVTSGLQSLLLTYRTPDAPSTTGVCDAVGYAPQPLYLHGSRTLAVRPPLDGCGKPIRSATDALAALGTVEIAATRLNQVTSPLAQASGCSDLYKDMLAIEESMGGGPRGTARAPSPLAPATEVCLYAVVRDPQGSRVGQLSSARQLTAAESAQVNGELSKSAVDASCARHQHTRFALLQPVGQPGGPTTLVALDGCAVQQDGGWWRATDRLRALVA